MAIPSDYIAIVSTAIALCALGATFWQAHHTKRHSILSVRPLLGWHKSKRATSAGCVVTFTVKNLGLGPAVIRKRFFSLGDERFDKEIDEMGLVDQVVAKAVDGKLEVPILQSGILGTGTAVPAGSEFLIAEILLSGMSNSAAETTLRSLPDLDFVVEYESMYQERFTLSALHGNCPGWGKFR